MSNSPTEKQIQDAYAPARERFAALGVDVDQALGQLSRVAVSLQCWQGDDVRGFESPEGELTGGVAATGNYPGRARTPQELRRDLDKAYSLIPGSHRLNLHAFYAETGGQRVERNELEPEHFAGWVDWANEHRHGLDFNPTCFSHPHSASGFTLAHPDPGIRRFWIEHCLAARQIGEFFGRQLGNPCVTNLWIPDGYKDTPVDRKTPRLLLKDSLDKIYATKTDPRYNRDAVEGKLFGLGLESYTVGSHEFYLGYAITNKLMVCLDSGHFHPTETIADKLSAILLYLDEVLLHVSRGVRWDSDHVVTLSDDLEAIAQEVVRGGYLDRVHLGLDYFDASINRVAAWVIGTRNVLRALLLALLEPIEALRTVEQAGDYTARLALLEEIKGLPSGPVWDYYCFQNDVPVGAAYIDEIKHYETKELAARV
ncbi:MAG TPA: L-rhamnose isomerase [Anaerolineales bacterium]|nr:L-rhamnose isomerase [Anaerolineales bacterium]